jgi:acetylglutamate kinase
LRARIADPDLGFVGEITDVDPEPVLHLLEKGIIPVIAPIATEWSGSTSTGQLLNINADTAAGAIAAALGARWLAFLTDVPGVRSEDGSTARELRAADAERLIGAGIIEGGMIPKVEACLRASKAGAAGVIVDGRQEHTLLRLLEGEPSGTRVG